MKGTRARHRGLEVLSIEMVMEPMGANAFTKRKNIEREEKRTQKRALEYTRS